MWATPLLAANEHVTINGGISAFNPCNGELVSVLGPLNINVQTNTSPETPHVSVHVRFKGIGAATNGDEYQLSFIANSTFDTVATVYDVPYHSVFVGKGSHRTSP